MLISEIKKWAKSLGYEVKNSKELVYIWRKEGEDKFNSAEDVETLATDIFNHKTNGKWFDYQKQYREKAGISKKS